MLAGRKELHEKAHYSQEVEASLIIEGKHARAEAQRVMTLGFKDELARIESEIRQLTRESRG
jgi:hypothetical protein